MTTEEKLKALGFTQCTDKELYEKNIYLGKTRLRFVFCYETEIGTLLNTSNLEQILIHDFTELLKLNQFYDKKSRSSTAPRH